MANNIDPCLKEDEESFYDEEEYYDCQNYETDLPQNNNREFYLKMTIPADLIGCVIGSRGMTLKRIEKTANCRVDTGERGTDDVTIYSKNPENIERAKTQIELILDGKRFDRSPTHFLSFSLAVNS